MEKKKSEIKKTTTMKMEDSVMKKNTKKNFQNKKTNEYNSFYNQFPFMLNIKSGEQFMLNNQDLFKDNDYYINDVYRDKGVLYLLVTIDKIINLATFEFKTKKFLGIKKIKIDTDLPVSHICFISQNTYMVLDEKGNSTIIK